ncbi:MAG: hypothetical protein DSY55_04250 [Clostridia bacterium]|nr:MAG: hypothetical protein DSY55_04250 [Clostridia bacterium]
MSYVFVLTFDPETERTIREIWQRISEKGYPSALDADGYRPHITLGVYDTTSFDLSTCRYAVRAYARSVKPFPIQIPHIGAFVDVRNVVFLGVTPSRELLKRHRDILKLCRHHASVLSPYYLPDRWTPHITLSFDLTQDQSLGVLSLGWEMALPIHGEVRSVQLIELDAAGAHNHLDYDFMASSIQGVSSPNRPR